MYCGSNSQQCLGGYDFACSNTTRGPRCAQCTDDHYKLGGTCYACPGGVLNVLLSIGATGCVVMFFLTLNALTAGAFDSIDIALLYLHVLSTIQVTLYSLLLSPPSALACGAREQHGCGCRAAVCGCSRKLPAEASC